MDYEQRFRLAELIRNQTTDRRYAGKKVPKFSAGEQVRVLNGENVGEVYEVIVVLGYAYTVAKKVYVNVQDDIPTWYYPWDLERVGPKQG